MSKRNKNKTKQLQLDEYTIRPVEKTDKWCMRKKSKEEILKGQIPVGDAPWGYIITIPYFPEKNTLLNNIDGYIVRCKKHCGNLLLQVVKKQDAPQYGIKSFARKEPNASKKKRKNYFRILNIRNLYKSEGKW